MFFLCLRLFETNLRKDFDLNRSAASQNSPSFGHIKSCSLKKKKKKKTLKTSLESIQRPILHIANHVVFEIHDTGSHPSTPFSRNWKNLSFQKAGFCTMPQAAVSQAFIWDWLNGCFFFALWFLFFLPLKNYQGDLGWT